jgi:hypothetical protein
VLESLPEWFAIPASIESYVAATDELPMLACFGPSREVVGFVSLKTHTAFAAEVYVMGVKALLAPPWNWPRLDRSRCATCDLAGRPVPDGEDTLALERRSQLRTDPTVLRGGWVRADRGIPNLVGA